LRAAAEDMGASTSLAPSVGDADKSDFRDASVDEPGAKFVGLLEFNRGPDRVARSGRLEVVKFMSTAAKMEM
jgi:hypothetical protein